MENTLENNKLIAEFMGIDNQILSTGDIHSWSDAPFFYITENSKDKVMKGIVKYSKYHTSWDWLMPVVEKIESTPRGKYSPNNKPAVSISSISCSIIYHGNAKEVIADIIRPSKIEAVYEAVVEFIKWYNENK